MTQTRFRDRTDAGLQLAQALLAYKGQDIIVYALPRGGVVLGVAVAKALDAPLDLLIPRKVGHPLNPEYALCAVGESGALVCSETGKRYQDETWFKGEVQKEIAEAKRRRETYLPNQSPLRLENKMAIIVDDGVATGLTMQAAILDAKQHHPSKIVVAIPVVPPEVAQELAQQATLVALAIPDTYLGAVGAYYESFPSVSDEEVIRLFGSLKHD